MKWDFRLQFQQGSRQAELDIYDVVGDPMFGVTAHGVLWQLRMLDVDDILVRINSVGGSVSEGMDIYNLLREHPARVTCRISGVAASIATVIACAASPGCVEMYQNSQFMVHEPYADFSFGGPPMREADLLRTGALLGKLRSQMLAIYALKTGKSAEELAPLCAAETWMTADEALELGFCDRVLGADEGEADFTAVAKAWDERVVMAYSRMPTTLMMAARAARLPAAKASAATANEPEAAELPEDTDEETMDPKIFAKIVALGKAKTDEEKLKLYLELCAMQGDAGAAELLAKSEDLKKLQTELGEMEKRAKKAEEEVAGMTEAAEGYAVAKERAEQAEKALEDLKKKVETLKKDKAEFGDDEEEGDDGEEDDDADAKAVLKTATRAQLRRIVRAAMDVAGTKDLGKLDAALMVIGTKVERAPDAKAVRAALVSRLIAEGKLEPCNKRFAMSATQEGLDFFLAQRAGKSVVEQRHQENPADPKVVNAKSAEEVVLTETEIKVAAQFNITPEKALAEKRKALGLN